MKTLTNQQLVELAGQYFAPAGLYQHTKSLPFLGSLECNTTSLIAGQWTELIVTYIVGASGLADGAWIKGTFKFYSDWALFQTTDPRQDNYVSAEYTPGPLHPGQTAATVQGLAVRFDQKGHERPFQKAIIVDIVDGYLNPGDKITVRMGDRRWGARGTRAQTFVEDAFKMRWYIDPVGTSRFAPIKPDIEIPILPGPPSKVKVITPRVGKPHAVLPVHIHTEDRWGNTTANIEGLVVDLKTVWQGTGEEVQRQEVKLGEQGWSVASRRLSLQQGEYVVHATVYSDGQTITSSECLSIDPNIPVDRPLFADLHVHSDDTVGTNSTTYNFSYAQQVAGLDIVGYTANDFNVTAKRWNETLKVIRDVNSEGSFVVFPGTEWCGNSAAGGDHNVVFLGDPQTGEPEFPLDRHGNVARSFEWNEDGPDTLVPGAWPLDELYATYAHDADNHLLMPHVGGRRCNLAWHHPRLERLLEIGSAWGQFEWLLRDAVQRGWRMGVSANSDEHRGRCGGGVPGTAVFGVKGGLTGVLAGRLGWKDVGQTLRARRTFATTGERLVGIVSARQGAVLQGDDVVAGKDEIVTLNFDFFGNNGFSSIEAWDASGCFFQRDLQREAVSQLSESTKTVSKKLSVKWGGARLYDRYREAVWHGSILLTGATIDRIEPFGGALDNPEDSIRQTSSSQIIYSTRTSGDFDGVDIYFTPSSNRTEGDFVVSVTGQIGGYVKVGNALLGSAHKAQPEYSLQCTPEELGSEDGKSVSIAGGAELFVSAQMLSDVALSTRVSGECTVAPPEASKPHRAIYFVGREYGGARVITSPIFIDYK